MKRLNAVPAFRYTMRFLSTMVNGYIPTHPESAKSKFEFGPMNSTVNNNTLEGMRYRIGGTTTPAFNKRLFLDGWSERRKDEVRRSHRVFLQQPQGISQGVSRPLAQTGIYVRHQQNRTGLYIHFQRQYDADNKTQKRP